LPYSLARLSFLFSRSRHPPPLHSFPTRRSSDLHPAHTVLPDNGGLAGIRGSGNIQRQAVRPHRAGSAQIAAGPGGPGISAGATLDRKSTRLNSSHVKISYAVFCLKKKKPPAAQD